MARSAIATIVVVGFAAVVHGAPAGKLPEVSTVLSKATDKMSEFAKKAAEMQQRAEQKQLERKNLFDKLRTDYEAKLALQVKGNEHVQEENLALQKDISDLGVGSNALVAKLSQLQKDNGIMRNILGSAQTKVDAAELFLLDSVHLVEDHDEALDVLQPVKAQATLDYFLKVASTKEDIPRTLRKDAALLQVPTSPLEMDAPKDLSAPDTLAESLSLSLTDISAATEEGKQQLEKTYLAAASANEAQRESLLKVQAGLNETRANMTQHLSQLHVAEEHLVSSRAQLKNRLQGMRVFAFKVDETVNAVLKSLVPLAGETKVANNFKAVAGNVDNHVKASQALNTVAKASIAQTAEKKVEKSVDSVEAAAASTVKQVEHVIAAEKTIVATAKTAEKAVVAAPRKAAANLNGASKAVGPHGQAGLRGRKKQGTRIQKALEESRDWIASHR